MSSDLVNRGKYIAIVYRNLNTSLKYKVEQVDRICYYVKLNEFA